MPASYAGTHAPLIEARVFIVLCVHGVVNVLVIVPPLGARWRRLRFPHNAGYFLQCLHRQAHNVTDPGGQNPESPTKPVYKPQLFKDY